LLGAVLHRGAARPVVVVGGPDRGDHPDLHRAVPDGRRAGPRGEPAAAEGAVSAAVLTVEGLRVYYHTPRGAVKAVDGVSFALRPGERFGLVGESGSGKTTIALALMRLIRPPGRIEGGAVSLDGTDLLAIPEDRMRRVRLADIAMIAQGAMNSLNPVMRVRDQIADALTDHGE